MKEVLKEKELLEMQASQLTAIVIRAPGEPANFFKEIMLIHWSVVHSSSLSPASRIIGIGRFEGYDYTTRGQEKWLN